MLEPLRSSVVSLVLAPWALHAQVLAGDPTDLLHTAVGTELHPPYSPPPMSSEDTASVDLEGDGTNDIRFVSGIVHATDANGSYNHAMMLHAGVEVALEAPGGWVTERLNAFDPIGAMLNWQAFDPGGANTLALASLLTGFGGQWITTGGDQWLVNASLPTEGYLAVRTVQGSDTLYGWIGLVSYVSQDSAWLNIDDMAIGTGTTSAGIAPSLERLTVGLQPDGRLVLQGPVNEVSTMVLYDGCGHIVRQMTGPATSGMLIHDEPQGFYTLVVMGRMGMRSFKLVW